MTRFTHHMSGAGTDTSARMRADKYCSTSVSETANLRWKCRRMRRGSENSRPSSYKLFVHKTNGRIYSSAVEAGGVVVAGPGAKLDYQNPDEVVVRVGDLV